MDSAFLYLDDIINQREPIYVRNTSRTRGVVVLTLNDSGRTHREVIPDTRFPICLSNKATPDMIRNSQSLRQFLDAGALTLVPKDEAEAELKRPGVKEALVDAYDRIGYKNKEVLAMRRGEEDLSETPGVHNQLDASVAGSLPEQFTNEFDENIGMAEPVSDTEVQVRVEYLVDALANKDMRSRQVKNELMAMDLSTEDLTYIIDNTAGIVQKYAKSRFAGDEEQSEEVDGHIEKV